VTAGLMTATNKKHHSISCLYLFFLFFAVLGFEFRAFTLSHIFMQRFVKVESRGTICLGWLQTLILLISVS
jgi:hypothetical protein